MLGLASALLFGAATPASKALLGSIQAQALAGLLYLGAALIMLPVATRERTFRWPWRAGRSTLLFLTGATVLGGIIGPLLILLGLKITSSGSVALWLNLESVATVILGHFIFHEHLGLRGWIAAGGTLIAAVLLAGGEGGSAILPVFLIALGCLCWGVDNHFTALIDGISPSQTTFWKGIVAGAFNLVMAGALTGGVGRPAMVFMALLVGAASYGLSITLYVTAAQGLGATRSQMVFSAAPFFGLLLSVTVLGEAFTGIQAIAAVIIVISLMVLFSEKHIHLHRHHSMSHQHGHEHHESHHDHAHRGPGAAGSHAHWHEHKPQEHAHDHLPDLHHRHDHDDTDKH
ncbi:Permease of the drug/metabolite transporter (DMT) superfamily [Olavius algarvensis Delta 1 endosymbiont]|nr:Permease of the drug/metabolite transporter (DMT) superfamily [Olavius algarvensis Delta 1 endosymbiont]